MLTRERLPLPQPTRTRYHACKVGVDFLAALVLGIVLAPLMLSIAGR
jgi:hypothetical protein